MPERKVAFTGDKTHNHQVTSPTRSPLSHPGGAYKWDFYSLDGSTVRNYFEIHVQNRTSGPHKSGQTDTRVHAHMHIHESDIMLTLFPNNKF